jgi:hypothetical protein
MRFLPKLRLGFWGDLLERIERLLTETPCLWSIGCKQLGTPSQLHTISPRFKDRSGRPLLERGFESVLLDWRYADDDIRLMSIFGLFPYYFLSPEVGKALNLDLMTSFSRVRAMPVDSD